MLSEFSAVRSRNSGGRRPFTRQIRGGPGGNRENFQIGLRLCDMVAVQNTDELQRAHREYIESRVLTAQPVIIVEMFYQVAIRALETAIRHLKSGDAMARSEEISRAQEAVNELMLSLDHSVGASFTPTLASLYAYVQEEIMRGHARSSQEALCNALSVLRPLLEGWSGVREQEMRQENAAPVDSELPQAQPLELISKASTDPRAAYQPELESTSRDWNC
jgi:flagellar protein FliS